MDDLSPPAGPFNVPGALVELEAGGVLDDLAATVAKHKVMVTITFSPLDQMMTIEDDR